MKNVRDIPGENEWRLLLLEEGLEPGCEFFFSFLFSHHSTSSYSLSFPTITIPMQYNTAFSDRVVLPLLPNNSKKNKKGASTDDKPSENNMTLQTVIDQDGLAITDASIELTYDDMSPADVLRRLIPSHIKEVPSSFEQVGHIAHMNLREDLLPYRLIIGAVLLEKNLPRVRTIINKIGTIENEWRVFLMEVLAGEDNTVAEVRQHGSRFCLDFKKVYWNSRLEAEHSRLVDKWFVPGEVIADAMAGVGPFAVPAGKKGCRVVANDLNPDSYRWLVENIKINKVESSVCPYEMDGREFMRSAAGGKLQVVWPAPPKQPQNKKKTKKNQGDDDKEEKGEKVASAYSGVIPPFHHIVMNLPATAVEFLDALRGSFDPEMWKDRDLPMVHVYAFLKKEETVQGKKESA